MKKCLFILAAMSLCLVGCDNDDNNKGGDNNNGQENSQGNENAGKDGGAGTGTIDFQVICEKMFTQDYYPDNEIGDKGLTEEQQSQLKTTFVSSCVRRLDKMPFCRSEAYDYYKCIYLDNTPEYWSEQKDKEEECNKRFGSETPEAEACIDQLFQACVTVDAALNTCDVKNEAAVDAYFDSAPIPDDDCEALLNSWGVANGE